MAESLREQAIRAYQDEERAKRDRQAREDDAYLLKAQQDSAKVLQAALVNTAILPVGDYDMFFDGRQAIVEYEDLLLGNNGNSTAYVEVLVRCPECGQPVELGRANNLLSLGERLTQTEAMLAEHLADYCPVARAIRNEQYEQEQAARKASGTAYTPRDEPVPSLEARQVDALEIIARALGEIADKYTL
jgi:hypothetical protein